MAFTRNCRGLAKVALMRICEMNWMQVEDYLKKDDRAVVPLGSTEQHAYNSLCTDSILSERVSVEAAKPLGIPVFPVQSYGLCPYFGAYPGTVSLRIETYVNLIQDLLDSLAGSGFKRMLLVSGHGGNEPARQIAVEWMSRHPEVRVRFHQWWQGERFLKAVEELDPVHGHASWFENFPFNRVEGATYPDKAKALPDRSLKAPLVGEKLRKFLGDGNMGGCIYTPG
jgi:creatinine amidohydrolase